MGTWSTGNVRDINNNKSTHFSAVTLQKLLQHFSVVYKVWQVEQILFGIEFTKNNLSIFI